MKMLNETNEKRICIEAAEKETKRHKIQGNQSDESD